MKHLAVIPARSGSKGLKDKNIKELWGKPLMAYTITAAIESGNFDEVMVSTDSAKYADVARSFGAEVPFLRSEKTSRDNSSSWDMMIEILEKYKAMGKEFDSFCLLQPTSPLRDKEDINGAYSLLREKQGDFIISVCKTDHPLSWCGYLGEDYSLDGFISISASSIRQKQRDSYRLNGAIYIAKVEPFLKDRNIYRKGAYAFIMDREHSVDIDNAFDFMLAEFLMKHGMQ